jgi:hypothetical protein
MIERAMGLLRVRVSEADPQVALRRLTKERSAPYDSQSNGGTEVGVMLIRGLFRTLKLCLESHVGKYIPVSHPVVPWLLEHTAFLLNVKSRGSDGLTPWARVKGRPFGLQILGFGEEVFYKRPVKGPEAQPEGNMGAVQSEGIFIGYSRSACTYVLATPEGRKIEARSVTRRPDQNRWSADKLAGIKDTPWNTRDRAEPTVRFEPAGETPAPTEVAPPAAPRRFRINISDLREHGYSEACPQCRHIEQVGKPRPGQQHSNACRARIIEAIGRTDAGKARIKDHAERLDRAMVEFSHPGEGDRETAAPPAPVEFQDAREDPTSKYGADSDTYAHAAWDRWTVSGEPRESRTMRPPLAISNTATPIPLDRTRQNLLCPRPLRWKPRISPTRMTWTWVSWASSSLRLETS